MIYIFKRHINPSRIILCREVRESRSLFVHIYTVCVVVSQEVLSNTNDFELIYLTHRSDTDTTTPDQSEPGYYGNTPYSTGLQNWCLTIRSSLGLLYFAGVLSLSRAGAQLAYSKLRWEDVKYLDFRFKTK